MTTKACVAVALAVWMTWAAFLALPANALPNHVVAGGVLGPVPPGTQTGPTNPANEATFAFYSTNAPAYAVLSGADVFTAADGTNPAFYFKDVGASWNWAPGDTVVVVTETVRGTNGWANVNYTSSARGTMQANPTTTDVGDATLEQIPPLTLTAGAGSVNVQWTALTDPTPNLASYHLYSATSPGGPYTTLVTVAHAGGAQSYLNSGLTSGTHCYELAVQYHRDTGATTYETTGRSEFACATVIAPPPTVVSTNPTDGATNVAVNAPVVITFDEAINTVTFAYNFSPSAGVTVTAWSGGNTIVTITHPTDFSVCTTYTVTITTAQNSDGTNIVNPYVFRFTTACTNPVIQSTSPVQGATSVPRTTNVIVTFSKAMNTGSVTVAINTAGGSASTLTCTWNPTNTIATCAATLGNHVQYFVNVSGTDTTGNALVPGAVPGG